MERKIRNLILLFLGISMLFSCAKEGKEPSHSANVSKKSSSEMQSDAVAEISMAANQEVADKKFVRKANVDMEVKDVYETTIFIENALKEMGGFVTSSNYESFVEKENTYPQSDEKAMLVRSYVSTNRMEVRVPTEKLVNFLKIINDKSLFLKHRIITAEDVSANIKMAELEKQRMQEHKNRLSKQINTNKNAEDINNNQKEINQQKIDDLHLTDELKYSTVDIFIKEPNTKVSQIEIPNIKSQKNQYQYNFWYSIKSAFVDGFYTFQMFLIVLAEGWLFILSLVLGIYAWRNRKNIFKNLNKNNKKQ